MNLDMNSLGPHLMLDCRRCNPEKIGDLAFIFKFLNNLPDQIGMTKITQPYVFPYSGLIPEDEGVTGFVVIAESHLSFHSFTQKDYFFFDLFSCMPFDIEAVKQKVIETFDVKEIDVHFVVRGQQFPRPERKGNSPHLKPYEQTQAEIIPINPPMTILTYSHE